MISFTVTPRRSKWASVRKYAYDPRNTHSTVAAKTIKRFFKNHPECKLAVNMGNMEHDSMIFIKNRPEPNAIYGIVHFNPNYNQTMKIFTKFASQLSGRPIPIQGYHAPNGNVDGRCSMYAWDEALKFMCRNMDPFAQPLFRYIPKTQKFHYPEGTLERIYPSGTMPTANGQGKNTNIAAAE